MFDDRPKTVVKSVLGRRPKKNVAWGKNDEQFRQPRLDRTLLAQQGGQLQEGAHVNE